MAPFILYGSKRQLLNNILTGILSNYLKQCALIIWLTNCNYHSIVHHFWSFKTRSYASALRNTKLHEGSRILFIMLIYWIVLVFYMEIIFLANILLNFRYCYLLNDLTPDLLRSQCSSYEELQDYLRLRGREAYLQKRVSIIILFS